MSKEEQHNKSVKVEVFAGDFLIWLDGQDAANQQLRMALKVLVDQNANVQVSPRSIELPFKAENIKWASKVGGRGPFELNEDYENPDHKQLLEFMKQHAGGAISSQGFYYWVFSSDGKTIGRKPSSQVRRGKAT
jgi:hypothetical protein